MAEKTTSIDPKILLWFQELSGTLSPKVSAVKRTCPASYKMIITCATDCPMRSVIINGGGTTSDSLAQGPLHMAKGRYVKGIAAMLKK